MLTLILSLWKWRLPRPFITSNCFLSYSLLQAFGVGAFEDEDDDIYGIDSLSNYDISMSKEDENFNHGWSGGPKNEIKKGQNFSNIQELKWNNFLHISQQICFIASQAISRASQVE